MPISWKTIKNEGDGLVTDAQMRYSTDLTTLITDAYTQIITGKKDLSYFNNFAEQWKEKGGAKWSKEINRLYKEKDN